MKKLITIAAAFAAISPAVAAEDQIAIHVEHADLDLATDSGKATLDARVDRAIRNACRAPDRSLNARMAELECRENLAAKAKDQVALAVAQNAMPRLAALPVNPDA